MQHNQPLGGILSKCARPIEEFKMREAVIVSTARTPIGKAYRGAFNDIESPSMAAPVIKEAISRARLEPGEIDDVIMGAALQQGTQGFNVARQCVIAAGLPVSIAGQSVDRQCSSGLMSISMGAKQIIADGMQVIGFTKLRPMPGLPWKQHAIVLEADTEVVLRTLESHINQPQPA